MSALDIALRVVLIMSIKRLVSLTNPLKNLMKIEKCSSIKLDVLKGALLTNENGGEFYIVDFHTCLDDLTNVLVSIKTCWFWKYSLSSVSWASIKTGQSNYKEGKINGN